MANEEWNTCTYIMLSARSRKDVGWDCTLYGMGEDYRKYRGPWYGTMPGAHPNPAM